MLISKNWLKEFVFLPDALDPKELAVKLTLSAVEVEKTVQLGAGLENVVVGLVKKIEKHPNADKLKVCLVDIGNETVPIVCGGSNVREGMKVALGKIGAKVKWHGEGDLVELKRSKIRGVESGGMICAADEIGLLDLFSKSAAKEIIDLTDRKAKPGAPLAEALGLEDVIFDIDNKSLSHRPDLWGHYGMAREIAALQRKKLKSYNPPAIPAGKEIKLDIKIADAKLCPRYMAVVMEGIKIQSSPDWMQRRLLAVGVRPINNIVDVTNYVMLELGQPLHAFDAERLNQKSEIRNQKSILVRRAIAGEKFTALDGKEYILTNEMLVIADEGKALALAGVVGGESSGISDAASTVIFESANFNASNIRMTSTKLGLRTDSSARFEKSLDPNLAELGLRRAVELTLKLCPKARVASSVVDNKHFKLNQGPIELTPAFLLSKIGVSFEKKPVADILERLGFGFKEKKGIWQVIIPTWRATKDISLPEDLVEEIVRVHGYDKIPSALPRFSITPPLAHPLSRLERRLREILASECGYTEVYSYSFIALDLLEKIIEPIEHYIELDNSITKDRPYLRRYLFPGLLEHAETNLHRFPRIQLFEIGKTYIKEEVGERAESGSDELLPRQDSKLGMIFSSQGVEAPFYEVSGSLETIGDRLGVWFELKPAASHASAFHPTRSALIFVNDREAGQVSEIHPAVQERLGIAYRVAVLEINLTVLAEIISLNNTNYKPFGAFPAVVRDIAFLIDKSTSHRDIVDAIKQASPLIHQVELFDVYEGNKIPVGKKSVAYHIICQSYEKTLTAGEVETEQRKIIKILREKFAAEIR